MATRSKKYLELKKLVDPTKAYAPTDALDLVKKTSKTKFDGSVEVHIRLGIDTKKGEQAVRGALVLPHATGKTIRVAAFTTTQADAAKAAGADLVGGKELIDEIKKSEKCNFDVAVAEPALMKDLAQIAKILGPKGLMPSPKNETVTPHIGKAVGELKRGKVTFKNDDSGNVHVAIGKVSFEGAKLLANFTAVTDAVKKAKPPTAKGTYLKAVTLAATMGPGIRVQI
ncbi:50S ribosomal protein L1 [Candidatus Uhrbacteria bacterium]|nr:50S ribosomal protein L1 [Candidatus Uhrbacteria bacterium]